MDLIFRCLTITFWLSVAATLTWLSLSSTSLGDAFSIGNSQTVFTLLTVTIATCSGLILWCEWRNDPADQSEYGEWTNKQLFYAIVFAISFFVGFISLVSWYFSA